MGYRKGGYRKKKRSRRYSGKQLMRGGRRL